MNTPELVAKLKEASESYYNSGSSLMTDAEFDVLVEQLRDQDPNNEFLQTVGAPPNVSGEIIEHTIPVGSQEKLKTREEAERWYARVLAEYKKCGIGIDPFIPLVLEHKLDGCTMVLYYENGTLQRAVTRGDGKKGEDQTNNVLKMKNVKKKLPLPWTGQLRGEVLLNIDLFEKYFKPLNYKNPRNSANGITRDKKGTDLLKHLRICYFDLIEKDSKLLLEEERKAFITQKFGLDVVVCLPCRNLEEAYTLYEVIAKKRAELGFEIDGVILRANLIPVQEAMGMSSDMRPDGQRCWKFEAQTAQTFLRSIELTVGHTGHIIPTGKVDPVQCGGVTISSILLNNFQFCARLGLGVGDKVLIERAGDVKPGLVRVLEKAADRVPVVPPSSCPSCGGALVQNGAYTDCRNEECEAREIRKIECWINKRNIKHLGDGLLEELFENQGIKEPQDLYTLTAEKLAVMRRGKGVVGANAKLIMSEIEKSKVCPLSEMVGSLCVKFLGRRQAEILIDAGINTLEKFVLLNEDSLRGIPGFPLDGTKAQGIIDGLRKVRGTIKALLEAGIEVIEPKKVEIIDGGPLTGKVICFTGCRPTAEEQAKFLALGGMVKSGVSKNLSHLVSMKADSASNKADKARELGVELIGYDDFKAWLTTGS